MMSSHNQGELIQLWCLAMDFQEAEKGASELNNLAAKLE
jgi:hypothetical protein